MPDTKAILRDLLEKENLTIYAASKKLDVSRTEFDRVFKQGKPLSLEKLQQYCQGLGYRLEVKTRLYKV